MKKAWTFIKKGCRKFAAYLIPGTIAVMIWGISADAANLPSSGKAEELKRPEKRLVLKMASSAQLNTSDKALDLGHVSHSSHVSHASHSSHASHASHYSHYSG